MFCHQFSTKFTDNFCLICGQIIEMAAVPHGMFLAYKARENQEKLHSNQMDNSTSSPLNYNSKYMNSIWGLYNRYSVHNFKKNLDETIMGKKDLVTSKIVEKSSDIAGSKERSFLSL